MITPAACLRRMYTVLAVLVVLGAAAAAGVRVWRGVVGGGTQGPAAPVMVVMTVRPGDSLWALARRYGDPAAYMLDRVDALARANRLAQGAGLIPGQKLMVPVGNPVEVARLRREVASRAATALAQ